MPSRRWPIPPPGPVQLLIGAEGGLDPQEMMAAQQVGFQAVRLGPRVLRTETAGLAALAAMQALWGDFRGGSRCLNRQNWATRSTRKPSRREVPKLRAELLDVQYDMLEKKEFPVVILISGVDGSGKGETINLLYSWMDPRHISTLAFSAPSDEERSRPYMWRYWRALPPKGKVGIFAGSWYSQPITDRITGDHAAFRSG
jgi:hypothetical protein